MSKTKPSLPLRLLVFLFLIGLGLSVAFIELRNRLPPPVLGGQKIQVVTSFYPLYFFASEIGGEAVTIRNLTPAGAEPHDYELTSQDLVAISASQLLVINGGLEPWADKVAENANVPTVVAGQGLLSLEFTDEDGETVLDPHVWLSPPLAVKQAEKIAAKLIEIDPTNAPYYKNNFGLLKEKLNQLGQRYREGLAICGQREFITSHVAFGYLAREYGLKETGIAGLSPEAEPSLQELASLADFARDNQVKYIYFETLVSPELAQTLAREVGAQTLVLNPLEGLTEAELAASKNYITEMDANLANLRLGLSCQ